MLGVLGDLSGAWFAFGSLGSLLVTFFVFLRVSRGCLGLLWGALGAVLVSF